MRRIDALRTLALSSALILALGCPGGASEEDTSYTGEPPSVEVNPPEEATDETSSPAEKPDTEASEEEEEKPNTEASEAEEE